MKQHDRPYIETGDYPSRLRCRVGPTSDHMGFGLDIYFYMINEDPNAAPVNSAGSILHIRGSETDGEFTSPNYVWDKAIPFAVNEPTFRLSTDQAELLYEALGAHFARERSEVAKNDPPRILPMAELVSSESPDTARVDRLLTVVHNLAAYLASIPEDSRA